MHFSDLTLPPPPSEPSKGIMCLPPEILRQIVIHLIYNPHRADAFSKTGLIPFASASKGLRLIATEFLFWSMDLFEASFGLKYRVLPSDRILELFYGLIHPSVPSFIRPGVRRLLIRDRDGKALRTVEGHQHLLGILNCVESLRSIHFDGHWNQPNATYMPFNIASNARLNETLVNLTFYNCDSRSPLFPCFLAPQRWTNLTRIEYDYNFACVDGYGQSIYTSPFARFESATEPVFPHLYIFVFFHGPQHLEQFNHMLAFIELHASSLTRLAILSRVWNRGYFDVNFHGNASLGTHIEPDHPIHRIRENLQQQCMRALWKRLPALGRLQLLELDVSVTYSKYAPLHVVRIPSLCGVNLRNESASYPLRASIGDRDSRMKHPVRLVCECGVWALDELTKW